MERDWNKTLTPLLLFTIGTLAIVIMVLLFGKVSISTEQPSHEISVPVDTAWVEAMYENVWDSNMPLTDMDCE